MQDLSGEVKGFIFLRTFVPGFSLLSRTQKGLAVEILIADMMGEEPPEADAVTTAICAMMLPTIHEAQREYYRKKQISRENGKNGGRPKKQADDKKPAGFDETDGFYENHNVDESNGVKVTKESINTLPLAPKGESCAPVKDPYSAEFELWWAKYPKKKGKDAAWNAWKKKKRDKRLPSVDELIEKTEQAKTSEEWRNGFIPDPSRWLNEARWLDEAPESESIPRIQATLEDVEKWGTEEDEGR